VDPVIEALLARAMQQDDGRAGLEQELLALEAMGPDGLKKLTAMGTMDQRGQLARQGTADQMGLLNQQMEQAQALATPKNRNWGTVGGNIASGLGDIAGALAGGRRMANLQGQQADLLKQGTAAQTGILDQQDAGRLASGNARYEAMRRFMEEAKTRQQMPRPTPAQGSFGIPSLALDPSLFGR
jgi:hypothetical protein